MSFKNHCISSPSVVNFIFLKYSFPVGILMRQWLSFTPSITSFLRPLIYPTTNPNPCHRGFPKEYLRMNHGWLFLFIRIQKLVIEIKHVDPYFWVSSHCIRFLYPNSGALPHSTKCVNPLMHVRFLAKVSIWFSWRLGNSQLKKSNSKIVSHRRKTPLERIT